MAEKDGLQNLGGDLGPPQRQFLLGLSSGLLDVVPSLGIWFAQSMLSDDAISDIFLIFLATFAYSISGA